MTQTHRILVTQPSMPVHARPRPPGRVDVYPGPGALTRDTSWLRLRHSTALMGFMTDRVDDAFLRRPCTCAWCPPRSGLRQL